MAALLGKSLTPTLHLVRHTHTILCTPTRQVSAARPLVPVGPQLFSLCQAAATGQAAAFSDSQTLQRRPGAPEESLGGSATSSLSESDREPEEDLPTVQLDLPDPQDSRVKSATFIKSSIKTSECPPPKYAEFAVVGRSNVGKSSLINMLTNRKSLAMVSKEPGKTRCINHFLINNSWYLVDLPGYGYARLGKEFRREFDSFTKKYFRERSTLAMVLQLVDSSIPPQPTDLDYSYWLADHGVPFTLVFTKADKRKKGGQTKASNMAAYKRALIGEKGFTVVPPSIVTSAETGLGKRELLNYVASLRIMFEKGDK